MRQTIDKHIILGCSLLACFGLTSFTSPEHIEIPTVWFPENSARVIVDPGFYAELDTTARPDRMIRWIVGVMHENPTAVLGIYGYADSKEEKPTEIALMRCQAVRDTLIAHGVVSGRLFLENKADTDPVVGAEAISRVADKKAQEQLRQRNRRVEFSMHSFDWKP